MKPSILTECGCDWYFYFSVAIFIFGFISFIFGWILRWLYSFYKQHKHNKNKEI